ncbi:MAG: hypothetical protein M1834_006393 [Cirrosporium novae-zelandiae]|nr:MAG: hypothetical protein M1834_006393 [Cirrosporium novae-zelandiae]
MAPLELSAKIIGGPWNLFEAFENASSEPPPKRQRLNPNVETDGYSHHNTDLIPLKRISIQLTPSEIVFPIEPSSHFLASEEQCLFLIITETDMRKPNTLSLTLRDPKTKCSVVLSLQSDTLHQVVDDIKLASKIQIERKYEGVLHAVVAISQINQHGNASLRVTISWRNRAMFKAAIPFVDSLLAKYFKPQWLEKDIDYTRGAVWTPRDFYDCIRLPNKDSGTSEYLQSSLVQCQLYPFQKRAVEWLLKREKVRIGIDGGIIPDNDPRYRSYDSHHSYQEEVDADGHQCFVSHFLGTITKDPSIDTPNLDGGILAEEMGLGKTVEMISLICLHKMNSSPHVPLEADGLDFSRATLIITPPSIMEQWKSELHNRAPSLKVFHYEGIQKEQPGEHDTLITKLRDSDVVLATYNCLSREIHYTAEKPQRQLRHEKKYQNRRSPLVKIRWWRVLLDEAQKVESGVSQAAIVARSIPRRFAWAVTGTPLQKNSQDLLGLLVFLRYSPYSYLPLWNRMTTAYKPVFKDIFCQLTLRHTKDQVRDELRLPHQKRIVITMSFTAVEEQYYNHLFQQMCDDCHLSREGAPVDDFWDPESSTSIEKMRAWLTTLRRTCLHPDAGARNRKTLGTGDGPLRTVAEVLTVMIDQSEGQLRSEQRNLLMNQIKRGQIEEIAKRSESALKIWERALESASAIVDGCRSQLENEMEKQDALKRCQSSEKDDTKDETAELSDRARLYRQRLRSALEVQHICMFFTANAFFQLKSREEVKEESNEYKDLEKAEEQAYDKAKLIRQELLSDILGKVGKLMKSIEEKVKLGSFVEIPEMLPSDPPGGIESRKIFDKFEDLCLKLNDQAAQLKIWRAEMVELLLKSLVDDDDSIAQGDEYEESTKQQDNSYVLLEALRAGFADRHDAITGQENTLIKHEMKEALKLAAKGEGPAPDLFKEVLILRQHLKPSKDLESLRGIITELKALQTSLQWSSDSEGSRANIELSIVQNIMKEVQAFTTAQTKASSALEKELDLLRDTMNVRLEYYRQLQQISDTVAPLTDEEDPDPTLYEAKIPAMMNEEEGLQAKVDSCNSKLRYLLHLQTEESMDDEQRICIICQQPIEIGVLTSCGHQYCKECMMLWMRQSRHSCPICKKRLTSNDFNQITYKPQELTVQEEGLDHIIPSTGFSASSSSSSLIKPETTIYSSINATDLTEIKNIDLPSNLSYGTKIDTLARHLIWLRQNDPGSKAIVFSQYRNFLGVLASAFDRFRISAVSIESKNGIEKFRKDPGIEVFLLHAKAHSSGLNLVNATHVFLCEPLINTALELQAIARVHRIGQHRPTTVWMYLISGTVEEAIYDISVKRRLEHIGQKGKKRIQLSTTEPLENPELGPVSSGPDTRTSGTSTPGELESVLDSANSFEVQNSALSSMFSKAPSGGELVDQGDVWNCLFLKGGKGADAGSLGDTNGEVGRWLRGEAVDRRRDA